ncbi:acyl-CoA thioesterase [Neptunitalea chrysea]|uniref:Acyl-CoA thioesterase n=1 Tax=Neptunitalea chrysea TaxID=1647581 RepID=A0A9W6B6W9_9FLAO|nr:acyl-CoA thioesterase [Neptunitalea chrysea]GLB53844.1 acyl-CoA thioesterase [Neptunitalea chrysea]
MHTIFKKVSETAVTFSELMLPSTSNFNGKVHGGYILSLMDQIAFACASKHSGTYCVTASVDTVNFLNPIEVGELVTMKACINYVGNTSMVVGIRIDSENIQTGKIKHCNSSYFTMVARSQNGKSVPVPGLLLTSKNDVRRFTRSMQQKALAKQYKELTKNFKFDIIDAVQKLKDEKVKIDLL